MICLWENDLLWYQFLGFGRTRAEKSELPGEYR